MPINYAKYPPNWKTEIVPRIKARAGNKCEFCGIENYSVTPKGTRVVLTIAHLDHDSENWNVTSDGQEYKLPDWCKSCVYRKSLNYE